MIVSHTASRAFTSLVQGAGARKMAFAGPGTDAATLQNYYDGIAPGTINGPSAETAIWPINTFTNLTVCHLKSIQLGS